MNQNKFCCIRPGDAEAPRLPLFYEQLIIKNNLQERAVQQIATEQHNRLTNIFALTMKHFDIFEIETEHRMFKWCNS